VWHEQKEWSAARSTVDQPGSLPVAGPSAPDIFQPRSARSPSGTPNDFWPSLPTGVSVETAVPKSAFAEKQLEAPLKGRGVAVSTLKSVDGRKITAAFWPALPQTFLDESALENDLALEPETDRLRHDFEQRGPEWNE
jgi:hypothetical protein